LPGEGHADEVFRRMPIAFWISPLRRQRPHDQDQDHATGTPQDAGIDLTSQLKRIHVHWIDLRVVKLPPGGSGRRSTAPLGERASCRCRFFYACDKAPSRTGALPTRPSCGSLQQVLHWCSARSTQYHVRPQLFPERDIRGEVCAECLYRRADRVRPKYKLEPVEPVGGLRIELGILTQGVDWDVDPGIGTSIR